MDGFQNAKDTFYVTLRDRLAALNADRTVVVQGATRPAVAVAENEISLGTGTDPVNAFVLRWAGFAVDTSDGLPLLKAQCEISFATEGSAEMAGMDRGRTLSAMGEEMCGMLHPATVPKQSFAVSPAVTLATQVFWDAPVFGPVKETADRIGRVVTVEVFAWKEAA